MGSSHTLDQLDICFDDTHAVANAGLLLAATLAERLGIEQAADQVIDLGERAGAHRPGRKLLTLVHALLAGGDCIDDADLLRCGATSQVLGHRVMAPSTLGTFLRAFTFGHVRQLDRLTEQLLTRAWAAGAGPGDGQKHASREPLEPVDNKEEDLEGERRRTEARRREAGCPQARGRTTPGRAPRCGTVRPSRPPQSHRPARRNRMGSR